MGRCLAPGRGFAGARRGAEPGARHRHGGVPHLRERLERLASGDTGPGLHRGVRKGLGGEGVGRTVQHLGSRYEFEPTPAGCRFKDLAVSLDVTIHLPRYPHGWQKELEGQ